LDGIDIGLFEGRSHLWPSDMFADTGKNAKELHGKLADNNLKAADIFLQCHADFVPMASNHPNAKIREKARAWFLDSLEFTNICEGGHTTGLPGVYFDEEPSDMSYGRACEEIAWRCEKAQEQGLTFSIEPHIGSIVPDPKSAEQLIRDVPGLTLTLDYTHFTKLGMPDSDTEPLIKHASHFHARGAAKGFLQASYKNNTIDYGRILKVMNDTGYSGYLGIEFIWVDWENCNEVDNVAEVIQMRDFFIEKMKQL
ncbi:MAG: sugar phosphate isomerase/epimerase, partial [Clostridia bacterium]|nr:sugar phosphate isomerase/epimerase [Clostridia bacterium]